METSESSSQNKMLIENVIQVLVHALKDSNLSKEMIEGTNEEVKEELEQILCGYVTVNKSDPCSYCQLEAKADFYYFPCTHVVHSDCITENLLKYYPADIVAQVKELNLSIEELQPSLETVGEGGETMAKYRHLMSLLQMKLDNLVGVDCPICGEYAIDLISEPLMSTTDTESAESIAQCKHQHTNIQLSQAVPNRVDWADESDPSVFLTVAPRCCIKYIAVLFDSLIMHRLEHWASPSELISPVLAHMILPSKELFDVKDVKIRRSKSTSNELTAMLEYVQYNTASQLANIQIEKSKKEANLANKVKELDYTNQRLSVELTKLRNNYSNFLSQEDETRRGLLRVQEKLNHAAVMEYECQNKLEMERLTRLAEERKFMKEKDELKALLEVAIDRADKIEAKRKQSDESCRNLTLHVSTQNKHHSAGELVRVFDAIARRLQYKALCRWRVATGAAVVRQIAEKKESAMLAQHTLELAELRAALETEHSAALRAVQVEWDSTAHELTQKYTRVLESRDAIYQHQTYIQKQTISDCFSLWKSSCLTSLSEKITVLKKAALYDQDIIKQQAEEHEKLKLLLLESTEKIESISKQKTVKKSVVDEEIVEELRSEVVKLQEECDNAGRGEVEMRKKYQQMELRCTAYADKLEEMRLQRLLSKYFHRLKDVWYRNTVSDLRMKLGRYPNLWRISKLPIPSSAIENTTELLISNDTLDTTTFGDTQNEDNF